LPETPGSNGASKRPQGRPPGKERPVTPGALQEIADLWLKNVPLRTIAKRFGVHHTTILHHLEQTICPLWRERMRSRLDEDLAKVALIERTAWERFHSATPGETRETIEKALTATPRGQKRLRIVKQATARVTRTGEVAWLQVIQWCLDFRARVHSHYAPIHHKHDIGGELRVAGMTPAETDQAMLQRLMEKIAERRRLDGQLGSGLN